MDDKWMTVKEVAEYLQVSPDIIYRLAQTSKIPASKVGVQWRFKRHKIDAWMEGLGKLADEAAVSTTAQKPV